MVKQALAKPTDEWTGWDERPEFIPATLIMGGTMHKLTSISLQRTQTDTPLPTLPPLSPALERFLRDRFSTTLEDPRTGMKVPPSRPRNSERRHL